MKIKELTDDKEKETTIQEKKNYISTEDIDLITELHISFMLHCTKTEWLFGGSKKKLQIDFVKPLLEKMKICKKILEDRIEAFHYTFDLKCLSGLNVLVAVAKNYGDFNCKSKYFLLLSSFF